MLYNGIMIEVKGNIKEIMKVQRFECLCMLNSSHIIVVTIETTRNAKSSDFIFTTMFKLVVHSKKVISL